MRLKICTKYLLPDPLLVLQSPPTHSYWKSQTKLRVLEWWQTKLRGEAELLPSLGYFQPAFMSLGKCHPIWNSASSPFEVKKRQLFRQECSPGDIELTNLLDIGQDPILMDSASFLVVEMSRAHSCTSCCTVLLCLKQEVSLFHIGLHSLFQDLGSFL